MLVAICDDMEREREHCQKQIAALADKHNVNVEFSLYHSGEELLFHMQDARNLPEAIYLDMKMAGMTGVEVAKKLRDCDYSGEIIFYTVSKEYYSPAFDVGALHYIVKGETTTVKFEDIFLRAVKSVREKTTEYIMCAGAGEYRNVEIKKIRFFKVAKRIITVFYDQEEEFSFYSSIGKIELRLKDYGFVRVNRQYLVAIGRIRTISFKDILLDSGEVIPVGRSYYADLKRELAEYADIGQVV